MNRSADDKYFFGHQCACIVPLLFAQTSEV